MIGRCKCQMCKNFLTPDKRVVDWKCRAFPDGIPELKIAYITWDTCDDCNNGIGFEREDELNNETKAPD